MKKKLIIAVSIISLVALLGIGCTKTTDGTTKNRMTRNNTYNDNMNTVDERYGNGLNNNVVNDYNRYNGYNNNTGLRNNAGLTDNTGLGNNTGVTDNTGIRKNTGVRDNTNIINEPTTNTNWNSALGDRDLVDRIRNICNRKDEVKDTSVAINGDTCYVGLDTRNGKLSEKTRETLASEIKREDPTITKVYFTENRNELENFIGQVGNTAKVDWNKLKNMFR